MDITTATPTEIDTLLADLYARDNAARAVLSEREGRSGREWEYCIRLCVRTGT